MPPVNVLALYDIHGNIDALDAVLEDAPTADVVVVGGDAVPGPFAVATLERLQSLPTRWIRGNGEREVAAAVGAPAPAKDDLAAYTAALTATELDADRARALGELPLTLELDGVLYCHASPRRDDEMLTRLSPAGRYAEALAGIEAKVVVAGHTHQQDDRRVGDVRFINAGSVGLPYEGDGAARWLWVADGEPHLRATAYDSAATGAKMLAAWPDARSIEAALIAPIDPIEITRLFEASSARDRTDAVRPSRAAVSVFVTNTLRFWARDEPHRLGVDARERAPQARGEARPRRSDEVAQQRAVVGGIEVDAVAAQLPDRLRAQAADVAHGDAVAAGAQRLGVEVGERLVLGEVHVADVDPRAGAAALAAAEAVRVDELAADGLRQPAVVDRLVERAQPERRQHRRGGVQPAPDVARARAAVGAQQPAADDRDHAVGVDHVAVVAQRDDVRARDLRIGGERDRDLGEAVVERARCLRRRPSAARTRAWRRVRTRTCSPTPQPGIHEAIGGCGEPHLLRLRRRSAEPNHHPRDPRPAPAWTQPYRLI